MIRPILAAAVVLAAVPATAQAPERTERVKFASGAASAMLRGAIKGYDGVSYLVGVRAGQTMSVSMTTSKGVVVPPGGGRHLKEPSGQVVSMKLFGRETGQSVTLWEQTVPAGSKNSWLHLHRDSD